MSETPSTRELMTCALDENNFLDIDEKLYIQDIKEKASVHVETSDRAGYGQFPVSEPGNESLDVTISFFVKKCDRVERMAVIQKVTAWAMAGGWLTVNYRPGLRLYVICTKPPEINTFKWTSELSLTLTAYWEAYWQEETPVSRTVSGTSSMSIVPNGTNNCYLEARIVPSGSISRITLEANGKQIDISGFSTSSTVTFAYDEHHLLTIKAGSTSLLSYRTAASADDLILTPNKSNTVRVVRVTGASFTATLYARGLYT